MSVYASNCKTTAFGPDERHRMEKEIKKLKEMLSIHLDLIQHQADQAASRETQLKALRQENELLLQKMERMERRLSVPARCSGTVPPPTLPSAAVAVAAARIDSATSPPPPVVLASQQTQTSGDERTATPPAPTPRRAVRGRARRSSPLERTGPAAVRAEPEPAAAADAGRSAELTAADRPSSIATSAESRRIRRKLYRKGDEPARHRKCMLTDVEYYQYIPAETEDSDGEDGAAAASSASRQTHIEIPCWTLNQLTPLSAPEPAESTDDAVFTKRHLKHEVDEKRRKRWDLQRLREQRAYEKLKQSYSRGRGGARSAAESEPDRPLALRPPASGALYLQVAGQVPVCAFGCNLPVLVSREFQLPWTPGKAPPLPSGRGDARGRR